MKVIQLPLADLHQTRTRIFELINECMEINNDTIQRLHNTDMEINLKMKCFEGSYKTESVLIDLQNRYFPEKP